MNIEIEYTKQDFINAYREMAYGSKIIRKRDVKYVIPLILIFLIVYLVFYGFNTMSVLLMILECIFIGLVVYQLYMRPSKHFKKLEQNHRLHCEYSLNKKKFILTYLENQETYEVEWSTFIDCVESTQFIFLVQKNKSMIIIPKRVFETEESIVKFKEYIIKESKLFNKIRVMKK